MSNEIITPTNSTAATTCTTTTNGATTTNCATTTACATTTNVQTINTQAQSFEYGDDGRVHTTDQSLTLIPYYAWAHRGRGNMTVWLPNELKF